MKKRWLSLLTALLLCLGLVPPALADSTEITVTPSVQTAAEGDTFSVTVALSGNPGFSAVQFTLKYDASKMECVRASTGELLSGMLAAANPSADGGAIVAAASTEQVTGDGVLATFTFRALDGAGGEFRLADVILSDSDGSAVPFGSTAGKVEAETPSVPPSPQQPLPEGPGVPPAAETAPRFNDTSGHWAEDYINAAVDKGFFRGYADGGFHPGDRVTRGAFVTVLWRMAGCPEPAAGTPFTDTGHLSAEFQKAIAWAFGSGYISGRTAATFAPGEPVTRQAAMKILYLYAGGVSGQELFFTKVYDDTFTDSAALAAWAKAPMYWGIYHELISGTSATTLGATGVATRAQLAKILVNYSEKIIEQ